MYGYLILLLITITFTVRYSNAVSRGNITLTRVDCLIRDYDVVKEFGCSLICGRDSLMMLNVNLTLTRDLDDIVGYHRYILDYNGKNTTYIKGELDICTLLTQMHSHFIVSMIGKEVRRVSNLPFECPIRKDFEYYLHNFKINSNILPPYMPELNWMIHAYFGTKNKPAIEMNSFGKIVKHSKKRNKG